MPKTWKKVTGTFKVRRQDDGREFELQEVSTFQEESDMYGVEVVENRLKSLASPDGRSVYTTDEVHFLFADEPRRAMTMI